MQELRSSLQHNRHLQLGLVVLILGALLGITYWQNWGAESTQLTRNTSLPAQLKIDAPNQAGVGEDLKVRIMLDTKGARVNTVTANFNYPTDKLEFREIQAKNSFVKIWFDKRAQEEQILLTGALPSPGFAGKGDLVTVVFGVREPGEAAFSFDSQSQVFEDGTSRNILGRTSGATVKLLP